MSPEEKALFNEYEDLKRSIAELEEKCEELKPKLIACIPEDAKINTGTGIFSLSSRKKWQYSPETTALEDTLKARQKEEQQTGVAVAESGEPFIVFKAHK